MSRTKYLYSISFSRPRRTAMASPYKMTVRRIAQKQEKLPTSSLIAYSRAIIYGGDDRIRTCGTLLRYNGLANRRFQPLSHVSNLGEKQGSILAHGQTLSRFKASYIADDGVIYRLTVLVFINKIAGLYRLC